MSIYVLRSDNLEKILFNGQPRNAGPNDHPAVGELSEPVEFHSSELR